MTEINQAINRMLLFLKTSHTVEGIETLAGLNLLQFSFIQVITHLPVFMTVFTAHMAFYCINYIVF